LNSLFYAGAEFPAVYSLTYGRIRPLPTGLLPPV
jgi:hypothetical protein